MITSILRNNFRFVIRTKKFENPEVKLKIFYPKSVSIKKGKLRIYLLIRNKSDKIIENLQIGIRIPKFLYEQFRTIGDSTEIYISEKLAPLEHIVRCLTLSYRFYPVFAKKANFELFFPEYSYHEYDFIEYPTIDFRTELRGLKLMPREESLKQFMLKECLPFENPYDISISEKIDGESELVDLFLSLLRLQIDESSLKGFRKQILKGWDIYLSSSHNFEALIIFSVRFENFLKIILYFLSMDFKLSLNDLIRTIYRQNPTMFKKKDREFWLEQNPMLANLRISFKERQRSSHEARELSSAEIKRGIKAIISSWLYALYLWRDDIRIGLER